MALDAIVAACRRVFTSQVEDVCGGSYPKMMGFPEQKLTSSSSPYRLLKQSKQSWAIKRAWSTWTIFSVLRLTFTVCWEQYPGLGGRYVRGCIGGLKIDAPKFVSTSLTSPTLYLWPINQPTPPPPTYPPGNKALWSGHMNHWFPLIRPKIKPLFLRGYVARGGLGD